MGLRGEGDSTLVIKSVLEHLTKKKNDLYTVVIAIILGYMPAVTQLLKRNKFDTEIQSS